MKIKTLIASGLLFITINIHAQQEKRIALVIGNSDYQYQQKLKNPVRDAILMAQTLESLDFDVILDTNITTKRKFVKAISEFGAKRESYDVGFIFYAGHGMQVNGKNYILPTQEEFTSEAEVKEFAVGAEMVMEYLTKQTDQVNVLILDACRNNPIQNTRSVGVGGLAEMQAKGSLIAFSTTAGNVAKDGDGDHSIYCISLVKNMLIEGISLDQVFRNVRKEVNELTGQGTVNYDQLTGNSFYLKRATFTDDIILIDSLIEAEQYEKGLEISIAILNEDKNNKSALIRKGRLYDFLEKYELANESLDLAVKLFPNDAEVLMYRGRFYFYQEEFDRALLELNHAIKIDSSYADAYSFRASTLWNQEKLDEAERDFTKGIELDALNIERFFERAIFYENIGEGDKAESDYNFAITIEPQNKQCWNNRGRFYSLFANDNDAAIKDLKRAIEIDSSFVSALSDLGHTYYYMESDDLALKWLGIAMTFEKKDPQEVAWCYNTRGEIYETQEKFEEAIDDYTKAIALDPENPLWYSKRAYLYETLDEENKAFLDYSKAIELEPENAENWYDRGDFHSNYFHDKEALNDLEEALKINPSYVDAINTIGIIYEDQGKLELAIKTYEKGIALEETAPEDAAYCYRNRGNIYQVQEKFDLALVDYSKAIALDPENPLRYSNRADLYQTLDEENKALIDYSKAIELDPEDPSNWYGRGDFHYNYGHYKEAIDDLEEALKIKPSYVAAINTIGVIYEEQGKIDLAIETYERGIALEETAPESAAYCYSNRAAIYETQEKFELALADYTKAIALDPENPLWYSNRAYLYETLDEENKALIDYSKAIELDPENTKRILSRAKLNMNMDNVIQAENDYKKAIKTTPNDANVLCEYALFLGRNREFKRALEQFEKAIKIDKNETSIYFHRAKVHNMYQEFDKAITDYNTVIEINPDDPEGYYYLAVFFESQENYFKSANFYSKAINKLGGELSYYISDEYGDEIAESKVYLKRAELYLKVDEKEMACEDYQKALELMKDEPFYMNKEKDQKDLEEKIKTLCN